MEGLDGVGKSACMAYLSMRLNESGVDYTIVAPTKAVNPGSFTERLFKRFPILDRLRFFRQIKFAARSNAAAKAADWRKGLILGDRSIITSYIAHYGGNRIINALKTLVINTMERRIYAPDYVLYLYVDNADIIRSRLEARNQARDIDENETRRKQMGEHYRRIKDKGPARVSKAEWIPILAEGSREEVGEAVLKQVLRLYHKHRSDKNVG